VGPRAWIQDIWSLDADERDQVFAIAEVDNAAITNAISETRKASQGKGFQASQRNYGRAVPARKVKLQIIGTHFSAAPIGEIARRAAGTFQSVSGVVELDAREGVNYRVVGELSKVKSCVWIEVASTGEPATSKVCST